MKTSSAKSLALITGLLAIALPISGWSAPVVSHVQAVDVTPSGFRVAWQSSEAATGSVAVFLDAAGTLPVPGALTGLDDRLTEDDFARDSARNDGILCARVSGLAPDTLYYVRALTTAAAGGSAVSSPLLAVRTASSAMRATRGTTADPIANPILRFECLTGENRDQTAGGKLLIAEVAGASAPLSAWVGENPAVLLDLNNLFAAGTGESLRLAGFEPLKLTLHLGAGDTETFEFYVPPGDGISTVRDPYLSPEPVAGPVAVTAGKVQPGRVFLEFPSEPGRMYAVEASETLDSPTWTPIGSAVTADAPRLFAEDNGKVEEHEPPAITPKRFYRLRRIR